VQVNNSVGNRRGLIVIVSDMQGRDATVTNQFAQIFEKFGVKPTVETVERFIEQQHPRLGDQSACYGDSLGFAAREIDDFAICEVFEADKFKRVSDFGLNGFFVGAL